MRREFKGVQRIVLRGGRWHHARHFALDFGTPRAAPRQFLDALKNLSRWPTTVASDESPSVQTSLGFTRRGLELAGVPEHVLRCFALKSPAFHAGAALRASQHLGAIGMEAPGTWDAGFAFATLSAVIHLHADGEDAMRSVALALRKAATKAMVEVRELQPAQRLPPPPKYPTDPALRDPMWVHFGYLDGLARVGIKGWDDQAALSACKNVSTHEAGEFVLGHVQNSGGNPWVAGPGRQVWPARLRMFFRNGSFGVLQQIEQDVQAFEQFVQRAGREHGIGADLLKAKLCGRHPDGRPIGTPAGTAPDADFDYENDPDGRHCPFGAHVRRMNPRVPRDALPENPSVAHFGRARPLLRRGLPYGPAAWNGTTDDGVERGLMAQFFCASIEEQYEHLVGQWADRVPLGSPDRGGARDPLIGAHDGGDGPFEIPRPGAGQSSLMINGLVPFTRTRGVAYLFYPSACTLAGIARNEPWIERDEDVK